jgi:uncharacterized membrane protein YkvA (DUF1232 family)
MSSPTTTDASARRGSTPKLGWFRGLYRYYKDPSASPLGKLVVFLAAIYVVMPVDLIPDVPFIGWLDDIGVMGLATAWLARMASKYRNPRELPPTTRDEDEDNAPFERRSFAVRR